MLSNPADKVKIKKLMTEISNSYTRIAAEKDLIKETIAEMHKEFDIPKKILNKMARTYYKQSFLLEQQESEEFENLYTQVVEQV